MVQHSRGDFFLPCLGIAHEQAVPVDCVAPREMFYGQQTCCERDSRGGGGSFRQPVLCFRMAREKGVLLVAIPPGKSAECPGLAPPEAAVVLLFHLVGFVCVLESGTL